MVGSGGILASLAENIHAPEPALRLLISILLGYPIALIHIYGLQKQPAVIKNVFFFLTGIGIGYFNFGWDVCHSLLSICFQYALFKVFDGSRLCVRISFVFNMAYLLYGYSYTGTDGYDIKWTMPHCVLTLRLIGLAFDVHDGKKKPEQLSSDQKNNALTQIPSLLEMLGHSYFPGGFLVGPQFSMKRYQNYISNVFLKECGNPLECIRPGLIRAALGFVYLLVYQVGSNFISNDFVTSESYYQKPFLYRLFVLGLWGKICLYKYISCWLLTEGVCIVSGLTYNGKNEKGQNKWDGCANVKLRVFENATRFNHIILSFNINTNTWVAQYIYKRLKFMGSKVVSQALTLFFLAVWHGLHSGYYVCFFMEFIVMNFEKDVETLVAKNETVRYWFTDSKLSWLRWIVGKIYLHAFMGYCLAPFVLFSDYWTIYHSLYYVGFVTFIGWICISPFVLSLLVPKSRKEKPSAETNKATKTD